MTKPEDWEKHEKEAWNKAQTAAKQAADKKKKTCQEIALLQRESDLDKQLEKHKALPIRALFPLKWRLVHAIAQDLHPRKVIDLNNQQESALYTAGGPSPEASFATYVQIAKEIKDLNKTEGLSPGQELNTILAENDRLRAEHIVHGPTKIMRDPAKKQKKQEAAAAKVKQEEGAGEESPPEHD